MKWIDCVIFDLDGTLTRTNQLILESFNYITEKYLNKKYNFEEITRLFGPPEEDALKNLLAEKYSDKIFEEFLEFYQKNHNKFAELYPNIIDILDFLKQRNVILSIFTGKGKHTTLITLQELNIKKYFDLIVTGNDVIKHKPAGEGIKKILNYFGIENNRTLMIGDSVSDIRAAKETKIRIAVALWDSYSKDKILTSEVDYVFENPEQLKSFLKNNA